MKFVRLKSGADREDIISALRSSDKVNEHVKFDDRRGRPVMKLREKKRSLFMTCEMIGGPSKDNGFLIGTFFLGRLRERSGEQRLSGVIMTAPLDHLLLVAFCVYFIIQSFVVGGITLVPVFLALFSLFLFKDEFKKQGIISRYLPRALRYAERSLDGKDNNATDA